MSYVFNMVGGGGGSLKDTDAILTVTVPTGSTVTMTKGGVTLTPTMWVQAADASLDCALFVIAPSLFDSQNAWTVTSTLSGDTASGTVTIDSNEQYDMILSYRVPSGYTEVEYLQSNGNQFINTPLTNTSNFTHIIADFHPMNTNGAPWGSGARQYNYSYSGFPYIGSSITPFLYIGNNYPSASFNVNGKNEIEIVADNGNCTATINGQTTQFAYTGTVENDYVIPLFAWSNAGTITKTKARIQHFQMLDENGDSRCDMYSCYRNSDSVAGMWDRVSETFYTNSGSGTFTVGPDM